MERLRREFPLEEADFAKLQIEIYYDEDTEVFLNGVAATAIKGFSAA